MKKIISILIVSLVFTFSLYSQSENIKRDTIYFDQDWKKTEFIEDAKYARVVKRDPNGAIVGTVRDYYYPSWNKQFEGKLLSENPDVPQGLCTFYFENGVIQSQATYENGKPKGQIVQNNEDGTKKDCRDTLLSVYPLNQKKLPSLNDFGSSRAVHTIDVQRIKDIIIQYSIADENSTSLASLGMSLMSYTTKLGALYSFLNSGSASNKSTSTKNTFFITSNREVAQYFMDTKGRILSQDGVIFYSENSLSEIKRYTIPENISQIYICIQNNNQFSSAIANLEVAGISKFCN